ncbi:MAG: NAD-dependent epimerase/dehydratase family protein [Candidatus Thorarchaeota archaeon]
MTKKSVLVTGALGFLGSVTVENLIQNGYSVWGMDLAGSEILNDFKTDSFTFIEGNILDDNLAEALPENLDYTIHLAGIASATESHTHPELYRQINVDGTLNILRLSHSLGVQRFVFSSSAAVYGQTTSAVISETHALQPLNPYGQSKKDAENIIRRYCIQNDLETVILRFFNLYGPSQPMRQDGIVPSFVNSIHDGKNIVVFGNPERTRSFVHVSDAAQAILLACEMNSAANQTFNICSSESISIDNLAKLILEVSGRNDIEIVYRESDVELANHSTCLGDLARELLGFEAKQGLIQGLRDSLSAFF